MEFTTYWQSLDAEAKKRLAQALGTSTAYLSQVANAHRMASPKLALAIEQQTQQQVTRHKIRPDVYPQSLPQAVVVHD